MVTKEQMVFLEPMSFKRIKDVRYDQIYKKHHTNLQKYLLRIKKGKQLEKNVHAIRVEIRALRSLLWLLDVSKSEEGKEENYQLKKMFKLFERARQLSVLWEVLEASKIKKKNYIELKKIIKNEEKFIIDVLRQMSPFVSTWDNYANLNFSKILRTSLNEKFLIYQKYVSALETNNIDELHKLRIAGKKIIYLMEDGIIKTKQKEDMQLIYELHDRIGALKDIDDIRKMLKEFKDHKILCFSSGDEKRLCKMLARTEKNQSNKVDKKVLQLQKRTR